MRCPELSRFNRMIFEIDDGIASSKQKKINIAFSNMEGRVTQ